MPTRLACLLLLALLPACGGGAAEPVAAPSPTASPTPSPTPVAAVFVAAEVASALLGTDVPGFALPDPADGFGTPPPRRSVQLCSAPDGVAPPPVPAAPAVLLQGAAGFDAVTQVVAVLPDEATAVAVLAAVQRHAARCEREQEQRFAFGAKSAVQTTSLADVVPVTSGAWSGVRQSSTSSYVATKTQRWQTQTAVLRRGNALLQLEVSGESAPPDLGAVLTRAVAKLDATL